MKLEIISKSKQKILIIRLRLLRLKLKSKLPIHTKSILYKSLGTETHLGVWYTNLRMRQTFSRRLH